MKYIPYETFDMPRAIKYFVPGLLASISLYMYLIIFFPNNIIIVSIEKNGLVVFISGTIILGFVVNSFEHYLHKFRKLSKMIYGIEPTYKLGSRLEKEISTLIEKGDLSQECPKKVSEQTKSDFWMWMLEKSSDSFREMILRQSLGSMYLFFSWLFLLNCIILILLLILGYLVLTLSISLTTISLYLFARLSLLMSDHYDGRFIDYYIYYFKEFLMKENKVNREAL